MEVSQIISEIDSQISKLQQARALLAGTGTSTAIVASVTSAKRAGRGRPKGSKNGVKKAAATVKTSSAAKTSPTSVVPAKSTTKRKLSPEGRKAIADAMKKRWADRRKVAAK